MTDVRDRFRAFLRHSSMAPFDSPNRKMAFPRATRRRDTRRLHLLLPMTDFIDLQIDKHIAIVTMNSPETRNALSSNDQYGAIEEVCKRISRDRSPSTQTWHWLATVLELSASFQAFAHATGDHAQRIEAAVGRLPSH